MKINRWIKKEAECYFFFDHSYFSVEITFFSTLASLFTLSKNCEHVKLMFILQEIKALTVLSDMLLRSWVQKLFMIEKTLSTGAEVPGKENTNSVTCLRLVRDIFFFVEIIEHFDSFYFRCGLRFFPVPRFQG